MSRHTSNESGGSDGNWFLEAVGARERRPTPIEEVEALESENVAAGDPVDDPPAADGANPGGAPDVVTFDGDPGTSTSSFHPVPSPPPPPDLEHPGTDDAPTDDRDATEEPTPVSPDPELSRPLRSQRSFRWPIVIGLLLAIGAVVTAAVVLPRLLDDEALAVRQSYYDAAAELRNYLPTAQGGLDAVTNPASSPDAVSGSVPVVAELEGRSFALVTVTAEPLPTVLPLIPSDPVDALEPLQVRGSLLGTTGSQLATRIGSAYVYRTSVPSLLDTGTLPISATTQEVNEISVRLASSLATDAGVVADLPDDPSFVTTRSGAVAAVERYAPWQDEYLAALTSEDSDAASILVTELETLRTELAAILEADLLGFRTDADATIVELAAELEDYLGDLTRS